MGSETCIRDRFPLWALGIRQAFGSGQPAQQEPSRKEQMNALKAQRNAQTKLATGMIPVVRLKSQADTADSSDAQPGSQGAAGASVEASAGSRAGAKKRKVSAENTGSAEI